jgi:hypothetical protein
MPYKTWASPFAVVAHITAGSSSSHIGGQNCCSQSFFSCFFFFIITNGNLFKVLFAKRHDNFKKQGIKRKLSSEKTVDILLIRFYGAKRKTEFRSFCCS